MSRKPYLGLWIPSLNVSVAGGILLHELHELLSCSLQPSTPSLQAEEIVQVSIAWIQRCIRILMCLYTLGFLSLPCRWVG